jgi:hypothetical protein
MEASKPLHPLGDTEQGTSRDIDSHTTYTTGARQAFTTLCLT